MDAVIDQAILRDAGLPLASGGFLGISHHVHPSLPPHRSWWAGHPPLQPVYTPEPSFTRSLHPDGLRGPRWSFGNLFFSARLKTEYGQTLRASSQRTPPWKTTPPSLSLLLMSLVCFGHTIWRLANLLPFLAALIIQTIPRQIVVGLGEFRFGAPRRISRPRAGKSKEFVRRPGPASCSILVDAWPRRACSRVTSFLVPAAGSLDPVDISPPEPLI